jgi:hypothetical protein
MRATPIPEPTNPTKNNANLDAKCKLEKACDSMLIPESISCQWEQLLHQLKWHFIQAQSPVGLVGGAVVAFNI